jgi:hypothetical protein
MCDKDVPPKQCDKQQYAMSKKEQKRFKKLVKQELEKEITKARIETHKSEDNIENKETEWSVDTVYEWVADSVSYFMEEPTQVEWIPRVTRIVVDGDNVLKKIRDEIK